METYWKPDGEFPDHEPNPLLEENRRFIIDKVRETGADLGIAWDGDADRCFFIDDTRRLRRRRLPHRDPRRAPARAHARRVDPLRRARLVGRAATPSRRPAGSAYANRVGHAFFKTRMRDEGAIFGGEVSGHYYFHDFYNADSGTIPALLVLEKLSVEGAKLSELVGRYRSEYFISGEINSEVQDAAGKMAELEERYADARISHLDGVCVDYDDWHFNVRPSNTEPLLRLCLESLVSREDMERRRDEVLGLIRAMIHALPVPTPFAVGRVNCYLVEDDPLTLVDTGPNSATSLTVLEAALAEHGRRVEDLERIVVTHQHMDHIGLVDILATRSGAEVCALDALAPWLARVRGRDARRRRVRRGGHAPPRHPGRARARPAGDHRRLPRVGRRGDRHASAHRRRRAPLRRAHLAGVAPARALALGHRLPRRGLGRAARRRPPHRPHLLQPAGLPPAGRRRRRSERPRALVDYLASLRATREMALARVLPGHGDPIDDHVALIDERMRLHERRAAKLLRMLAERPSTAFELAQAMWGNVAVTQAYLTLSEVLGHVDLLLERGDVVEDEVEGVVRFRADPQG